MGLTLNRDGYPLKKDADGQWSNIFPAYAPLNVDLRRADIGLSYISNVNGRCSLALQSALAPGLLKPGDYIVFFAEGLKPITAKALYISEDRETVRTDARFIFVKAEDMQGGVLNYKQDWGLEVRYVDPSSSSGDQDAGEIITDYDIFPSSSNGEVVADISTPADLISTGIDMKDGGTGLSVCFNIQYRESCRGGLDYDWVSPSVDNETTPEILLVHASAPVSPGFTDSGITKRYVKGYPLPGSYIRSRVNDIGYSETNIYCDQLNLKGESLSRTPLLVTKEPLKLFNGVFLFEVDTSPFYSLTAFVRFTAEVSNAHGDYYDIDYSSDYD